MKRTVVTAVLLASLLITCSKDSPAPVTPIPPLYNWSPQPSGSSANLYDVFFTNSSQGWVVGELLTLLATSNGGVAWPQVPSSSVVRDLTSVVFVDSQNGWMTGGSDANPIDGYVFVSRTGGSYPTQQEMVDHPLNTVFFLNKNTGWAGGDSSILIHTINGGVDWSETAIGTKNRIHDLQFLTSEMGWAATNPGGIYRTKDGITWTKEDLGTVTDVRAIHFLDTLHGWACGAENTLLRRELDSNNKPVWIKSSIPSESGLTEWRDIFFVGQQKGWVVGSFGNVYTTGDGGVTWTKQSAGSSEDLNAIYMVSNSSGWIVGDNGAILTFTP